MTVLIKKSFPCVVFLFFASALLNSLLPFISGFNAFRWFQVSVVIISFLLFARNNLRSFIVISAVVFLFFYSFDTIAYSFVLLFFDLGYWVSVVFIPCYFLTRGVSIGGLAKGTTAAAGIVCILYLPTILMGLGFWYAQGQGAVTDFLPSGFYGIRPWSHLATWLIPLIMGALAMSSAMPLLKHRLWKNLLVISAALWFVVLLGSGARGSMLAQLLGLALMLAIFGKKAFPVGRFWLVTIGLGILLYLLLIVVLPFVVFSSTEDYSVLRSGASGRLQLWEYALKLSTRYFPLGAGPLSYTSETPVTAFATPHSLYFRWAAEYGWLFVLVFIGGFMWAGVPSWLEFRKAPAQQSDSFRIAIFWAVLAAFIHASVSGVFTSPYSLLVGLPILAVYFGYVLKDRFRQEWICQRLPGIGHTAAVLFGISVAMISSMHAWQESAEADQNRYVEEYHQPLAPRFWLHGRYTGEEYKDQEVAP